MRRLLLLAGLAAACLTFAVAGEVGGSIALAQGSLTLSPAEAKGTAVPGQRVGPFGVRNSTRESYSMDVFPVLLGQNRDGGLYVRQDPASVARARRLLRITADATFALRPGGSRAVGARLLERSAGGNFYGGVLFRGTPQRQLRGNVIAPVLQLNARVFLRPPAGRRRIAGRLTGLRAEQVGNRRLRALVGLANTGNVDVRPRGRLVVRDLRGRVRFRGALRSFDVLPGAEVELPVDLEGEVLPAGRYEMEASVRVGRRTLRIERPLELFGPNQVATTRAEIVSFEPPQVEEGGDAEVSARYRNTGNVPFGPRAELVVAGRPAPSPLQSPPVAPGEEAEARGSVRLEGRRPRELTVRLLAGERELDTSSVTVTPAPERSLSDRVGDWIAGNAVLLVALLVALVLAMGVLVVVVLTRRGAK